jgi:hypothetical protein
MNIEFTLDEITELCRRALNLPPEQHLKITVRVAEQHPTATLLRQICREFPRHLSEQKIAAIKAFRDRGPQESYPSGLGIRSSIGLGDAKWAIENPDAAVENLEKYGQIRFV